MYDRLNTLFLFFFPGRTADFGRVRVKNNRKKLWVTGFLQRLNGGKKNLNKETRSTEKYKLNKNKLTSVMRQQKEHCNKILKGSKNNIKRLAM